MVSEDTNTKIQWVNLYVWKTNEHANQTENC